MPNYLYYLFYKPFQVLCQFSPEGDKKTLADFLQVPKDVYPLGRLDYDSEGVILLTNDKTLNAAMLSPGKGHEREYWVQVEGAITEKALMLLSKGVTINLDGKEHKTLPATARLLDPEPELPPRNPPIRFRANIPTSWISLTLTEGKNRQVRRMTAAVGFPTLRLVRYRIGKLTLDGLEPGDYRSVARKEIL
jgi:23S rRNA pseudouridine2457 synthase